MNEVYKTAILRSFLELKRDKAIKNITVSEIVENCGISRQTFYRHFGNISKLVEYYYEQFMSRWFVHLNNLELGQQDAIRKVFEECIKDPDFYSTIHSFKGLELFKELCVEKNRVFLQELMKMKRNVQELDSETKLCIDFVCFGANSLLLDWIASGMVESPYDMAEMVYDCLPDFLK